MDCKLKETEMSDMVFSMSGDIFVQVALTVDKGGTDGSVVRLRLSLIGFPCLEIVECQNHIH